MKSPTKYVLTLYQSAQAVGRITSNNLEDLEEKRSQWNQKSENYRAIIERHVPHEQETIPDIPANQLLTQSNSG